MSDVPTDSISLLPQPGVQAHWRFATEPQTDTKHKTHQFRPVADGVDSTVLHDNTLVVDKQELKGLDHPAKVRLILGVLELPLGVEHIVHGEQVLLGKKKHAAAKCAW